MHRSLSVSAKVNAIVLDFRYLHGFKRWRIFLGQYPNENRQMAKDRLFSLFICTGQCKKFYACTVHRVSRKYRRLLFCTITSAKVSQFSQIFTVIFRKNPWRFLRVNHWSGVLAACNVMLFPPALDLCQHRRHLHFFSLWTADSGHLKMRGMFLKLNKHFTARRRYARRVFATATWLAGWVGAGWLAVRHTPVFYQNG